MSAMSPAILYTGQIEKGRYGLIVRDVVEIARGEYAELVDRAEQEAKCGTNDPTYIVEDDCTCRYFWEAYSAEWHMSDVESWSERA